MSLTFKAIVFAIVALSELAIGVFLWRRHMALKQPRLAVILAAQAAATVGFVAMILFVYLE